MQLTFGDFAAGAVGPFGAIITLIFVIWVIVVSGLLVTKRHHEDVLAGRDQVIESERANYKENIETERRHYEAIIKLKDERILIAEGEAEQWKRQALAKEGIRQRQSRGTG